ncbi:ABC transporter substrate-binding protein [Nocardiopsis coralliicola]
MVRRTAALGAGAVVLTVVSACSALTPGSDGGAGPDPDRAVSTELPDEEATLRLAFTDAPEMHEALAAAFEEQHPQVDVVPEYTEFTDYIANIKLTMTSDDPPDLAQWSVQSKDLIASGHLADLDPYAEAYGWNESFPASTLEPMTLTEDGKKHGTGYLYAVPSGMSLSGIFYNSELAEEAGIDGPPETLEEFEQALAKAKDAGLGPLHVGALDSGGIHLWTELLNATLPPGSYQAWANGEEGAEITGAEAQAATEKLVEWTEAGYINDSANGLGQADSTAEFAAGESVFLINGNWAAEAVDAELGEDAGFFTMPPAEEGRAPAASGSSVAYSVSSQSANPDAAAAFLDFLSTPEAAEIVAQGGFEPPDAELGPDPSGVRADIHDGYASVIDSEQLHLYPDSSSPSAYNAMVSGVQGLFSGETEPAAFLEDVQEVRDEYQAD